MIMAIPSNKAPGIYGYNSGFFKATWEIVRSEVVIFFATGKILSDINISTLTLVPEVRIPNSVTEFKPIVQLFISASQCCPQN